MWETYNGVVKRSIGRPVFPYYNNARREKK